ncbi:MAG: Imm49 family immunity protein [Polyangiales bacterium]
MSADSTHPFDPALAAALLAEHRADAPAVYAQAKGLPVALHRLAQVERNLAAYAARCAEDALVAPALRLAGRASAALFACATAAPDETVRVPMQGDDVFVLRAARVGNLASFRPWMAGFYAALAVGDAPALDALCRVESTWLARATGVSTQPHVAAYVDSLRAHWLQTRELGAQVARALDAANPAAAPSDEAAFTRAIDLPAMHLLQAIVLRDHAAVADALAAALEAHACYWAADARAHDPSGIVALPLAALLAHARRSDLLLDVSSPYLPRILLQPAV